MSGPVAGLTGLVLGFVLGRLLRARSQSPGAADRLARRQAREDGVLGRRGERGW